MEPPELALNYKKGRKFKKCFFFFAALTSFSKRQIPSLLCELLTLELDQIKFLCFLEIVFFLAFFRKGPPLFYRKKEYVLKKEILGDINIILYSNIIHVFNKL